MSNNVCSNEFEHKYNCIILGLDEAGRGPIAGPLVVAGVCMPIGYESELIYDSKKLSEKKRNAAFDLIKEEALWYEIKIVDEATIDSKNIYRATQWAMEEIVKNCELCEHVLSDAMPLEHIKNKEWDAVVKGDQKSINIAAASILAKVTRDNIMKDLAKKYPQYGFDKHKGYPTKQHLQALDEYGICPHHRKSYSPVQKAMQLKLF